MTLLWLRFAVLLYGIAALAVLPAALFHFVSLAETLNAAHHRLPVETHEVQSLLALILALAFLVVYAWYRSVSIGIFVLPIAFMLATLAAPPSRCSRWSARRSGTGASWLIRSA